MGLVETIRNFPTFIDIIRVGQQRFYKDDVKLRVITVLTNGGLFYLTTPKTLNNTMLGLVKNKKLPDLLEDGGQVIEVNKKKYYENLAKDLLPLSPSDLNLCQLCKKPACGYCNNAEDTPMKCYNCGTTYHECCAALYSWKVNIGLKHVFRCITCGTLLKLMEENVYAINGKPMGADELDIDVSKIAVGKDTWSPPKEIIKEQVPSDVKKESSPKEEYNALTQRKRTSQKKDAIRMCPVCSTMIKPNTKICPKCGSPV
jgi:hypothetical protein